MVIMNVSYRVDGRTRRPDIPEDVSFRVVKDNGDGTCEVEILSKSWPPSTSKADIWRRATDAEAETIDALLRDPPPDLGMSPVKLRRLWDDATSIDHTEPLFETIRAIAVQHFGEERADALLKPSE